MNQGIEPSLTSLPDSSTDNEKISYLTILNNQLNQKTFQGHIENFAGLCMLPIGLAGPLCIRGDYANGNFRIPMATTEGALVASYNRGLRAGRKSGGFWAKVIEETVQRCPLLKFTTAQEAFSFIQWLDSQRDTIKLVAESSSRYAVLKNIRTILEGNEVIVCLEYQTGDASGQNMVTLCSQKVCDFIRDYAPTSPQAIYIEGNASGDKKVGIRSLGRTRGKRVIAEITIPKQIISTVLKTTPQRLVNFWQSSTMSQIKTGSAGNQAHVANGLAAMFLATGQDVACISEAATGFNRAEVTAKGELYASLTLPNLIIGSVGGGTGLPTQRECLEMMDCYGTGKANKLAEIMTAVALAGELSIGAAIAEGHFTRAHQKLGR
ncbi:hydroxymethylglutaryl-CoA reductase [Tunicatimonas pelagia]|uniref:hydroxymethylglutaryl-CoA reductase n=1 Tax=Tunicatimonas pelagia TaxID=931531 RepID=UPI002666D69E|nr:hydroxymethylglutaryl-CoA reductase [Tunicatimonas pelagia]WKN44740.1 hydroxymethylglutaryl-CoA reductase [Tunicatimonas pelagia]